MGNIARWSNDELVKSIEQIIKDKSLGVRHFDGKVYALFTWGFGDTYAAHQAKRIRNLGYKVRITTLFKSRAIWVARK
jgi:hypothetical protein